VQKYRECKSQLQKKHLKKQLPAITPSGIFYPTRSSENLKEHSGLLCIDFDAKDNPHVTDWEELKHRLSHTKNIAYCGLSISGKGVFAILPIAHPEHHSAHFNAADIYFALSEGLVIDVACKDVCRLRTISYDQDGYFNHNAEALNKYIYFAKVMKTVIPSMSKDEVGKVLSILDEIKGLGIDITNVYIEWFQIGCVLSKVFGEQGREKFHEFSQFSPKYNYSICDKQYTACMKKEYRYTVGTLIYILNKYR